MMIGAGLNRLPNVIGWSVSSSLRLDANSVAVCECQGVCLGPQRVANALGHEPGRGRRNFSYRGSDPNNPNNPPSTVTFTTNFSSAGNPYSAQAVTGDSGGGVFQFVNGAWQLAGVMDAVQSTVANQPGHTAVFGNNQTLSADLSQYRDEIEQVLSQPDSPWQNQVNRFDVARLGSVNAHDVLLLINGLQNGKGGSLSGVPAASDPLVDVNGDGTFDSQDVLVLINFLTNNGAIPAATSASQESTSLVSSNVAIVPEPSTGVLALLGIVLVGLARRMMTARRQS